jgi:hypothetical protein
MGLSIGTVKQLPECKFRQNIFYFRDSYKIWLTNLIIQLYARTNNIFMNNRGRFQAQDNNLEKSAPWATNDEVSKEMGNERIDNLQAQLTQDELNVRIQSLQKAREFVDTAPTNGHYAQIIKSFFDDVRNRVVRVDVEIRAGRAFITVENNQ